MRRTAEVEATPGASAAPLREVPSAQRPLRVSWLGRCAYLEALARQEACREEILRAGDERPETLYLLEHPHVFTLGRNAQRSDVLATDAWLDEHGVQVIETDRGGKVTYHGPGQLVGYPVISLQPDRRDVRRYVADLMQVLVQTLRAFGIETQPGEGDEIGVWTLEDRARFQPRRKIASIGVHLKRWTTTHGFALNVQPELDFFGGIVPCGLDGIELTSMTRELGREVSLEPVATELERQFRAVFQRPLGSGLLAEETP